MQDKRIEELKKSIEKFLEIIKHAEEAGKSSGSFPESKEKTK